MIPHSKPFLDQADSDEVLRVLRSGRIVQGEEVRKFENALASMIGVKAGAAVSSGTAALHLALLSLGIGKGDEVIIPSYVCSALLNAVRYVDAVAVLADIDLSTYNIDPVEIERSITGKTRCIIVPHMFGLPADMDAILSFGIPVIEDCALSVGSSYKGRQAGSMGTLSVFSFYATKMMTTGEGGMVLSNNASLIETVKDLRDYDGKETDHTLRYNYKMTDFQAALGLSQLDKLPSFIEKRRRIASRYTESLDGTELRAPYVPERMQPVFYRYVLEAPDRLKDDLAKAGVECRRPVFRPLHHYLGMSGYPNTDTAWERSISIPIYPALSDAEVAHVAEILKKVLVR